MINFHVLTLFTSYFEALIGTSILKKGLDKGLFTVSIKDIRDKAINKYNQVDDLPYGGGPGMVIRPEPVFETYESLNLPDEGKKVIYFSPKGKVLDHNYILSLTNFKNIVLICGHYEGVDQRIIDTIVDDEVSLGDFVLTGGEIPAMALIDAVARQIKGVIKEESLKEESFAGNFLEYRHYTRPAEYRGLKVPDILLSGNHKKIDEYRFEDSIRETLLKRPDLIKNNKYCKKINDIINKINKEEDNEYN